MKMIRNGLLVAGVSLGIAASLPAKPFGMLAQLSPDEQQINIYISDYHKNDIHVGDYVRQQELLRIMQILRRDVCCIVEDSGEYGGIDRDENFLRYKKEMEALRASVVDGRFNKYRDSNEKLTRDTAQRINHAQKEYDFDVLRARRGGFLDELYGRLKKLGIEVYNAECRLINQAATWPQYLANTKVVLRKIKSYKDQEWESCYQAAIARTEKVVAGHEKLISTHHNTIDGMPYREAMDKLSSVARIYIDDEVDGVLVDMRAIHKRCGTKKKIAVFVMGAAHIHNIANLYRHKGWIDIYEDGYLGRFKEYENKKARWHKREELYKRVEDESQRVYWSPYEAFVRLCANKKFRRLVPKNIIIKDIVKRSRVVAPKERFALKQEIVRYKTINESYWFSKIMLSGLTIAGCYAACKKWFS